MHVSIYRPQEDPENGADVRDWPRLPPTWSSARRRRCSRAASGACRVPYRHRCQYHVTRRQRRERRTVCGRSPARRRARSPARWLRPMAERTQAGAADPIVTTNTEHLAHINMEEEAHLDHGAAVLVSLTERRVRKPIGRRRRALRCNRHREGVLGVFLSRWS